jgi:periplasmic protein TonB
MAHPSKFLNQRDDLLLWAIVLSLALHSVSLILLPGFSFSHIIKTPEPLTVELQQLPPPPKVEPEKPKQPEPPKPEQPKPKLEKVPPKPLPPPPVAVPPPPPTEAPPPAPVAEQPKAPPAVIAVEQKPAEPTPAFTAPKTDTVDTNDDLGEVRAAYGRLLREELTKHTRYPAVATLKGWEGKVKLRLQVDKEGNVLGTPEVVEGSGHTVLDDDAVKTILKDSPLPVPPPQLNVTPISIITTIDYHKPR